MKTIIAYTLINRRGEIVICPHTSSYYIYKKKKELEDLKIRGEEIIKIKVSNKIN